MKEQFLYCEMSKVTYRKNELTVPYLYYKDEKGEEYTTTETDDSLSVSAHLSLFFLTGLNNLCQ